jgi:hypothetical protein
MIILKYIILSVLGLTLAALVTAGLYLVLFKMLPDIYKNIKETWLKK